MKTKIDKSKVGSRIFNIRQNKNLTLEEFGKIFNAGKSNVQKWEIGSSLPTRERLDKIAKIGNTTINQLLYGSVNEFLENNIEEIFKFADEPLILSSGSQSYLFKINCIDYILSNLKEHVSFEKDTELLEDIKSLLGWISSFICEFLIEEIEEFREIFTQYKEILERILKDFPTEVDKINFDFSIEIFNEIRTVERLLEYVSIENEKFVIENYQILKHLSNLVISIAKMNSLFVYRKTTLYITLSNLIENNVNLHTDNFIGFDFIFKENTFIPNKYGIDNYNIVVGLKIEKENSLYYLANYPRIEDVPLNTEAQYFILNHDNSYFISKITEKPDCKYLAPILGKLE